MRDSSVRKSQTQTQTQNLKTSCSRYPFEKSQQTRIILIYNARIMSILILLGSLVLVALASCWIFRK